MKTPFVPAIQKPCPMSWDAMQGDEKRRFCEHCQLHVHNLNEMSQQEQVKLLKSPGERKCITYTAPANAKPVHAGTWLTLQTATGWRKAIAALFAAGFSMFASSCQMQRNTGVPVPPPDAKQPLSNLQAHTDSSMESGKMPRFMGSPVSLPTPWWKKILFMD